VDHVKGVQRMHHASCADGASFINHLRIGINLAVENPKTELKGGSGTSRKGDGGSSKGERQTEIRKREGVVVKGSDFAELPKKSNFL